MPAIRRVAARPAPRPVFDTWAFVYVADFAAVARGANQLQSVKVDSGVDFIVQGLHFGANFASAVNLTTTTGLSGLADINGYEVKLAREAGGLAATQSNGFLSHVKVAITQNDRPWMASRCRADLLTGEPGRLFLLPKEILIPGNDTVNVTVYNELPATVGGAASPSINAQLLLIGYKRARRR